VQRLAPTAREKGAKCTMPRELCLATAGEQGAQMPELDSAQPPLVSVVWHLVFSLRHGAIRGGYINSRANDSHEVTVIDGVVPPMTTRHRKNL
jgi:hypothetical protein